MNFKNLEKKNLIHTLHVGKKISKHFVEIDNI